MTCQEFVEHDRGLADVGGLVTATAERLGNPLLGVLAMTLATRLWHVPAAFDLALRSLARRGARVLLHGRTSLLLSVVRASPSRPHWSRAAMIPYVLLADVQNAALARPAVSRVDASRRGR